MSSRVSVSSRSSPTLEHTPIKTLDTYWVVSDVEGDARGILERLETAYAKLKEDGEQVTSFDSDTSEP